MLRLHLALRSPGSRGTPGTGYVLSSWPGGPLLVSQWGGPWPQVRSGSTCGWRSWTDLFPSREKLSCASSDSAWIGLLSCGVLQVYLLVQVDANAPPKLPRGERRLAARIWKAPSNQVQKKSDLLSWVASN